MLRQIVFFDALQTGIVNVKVVASAQNRAGVGRFHFQKHFIVANQHGAGFGGAIVDHDGDFGALDVRGEAAETLCRTIEFSECAFQCSWAVILPSGRPRPDERDRNDGD